MKALKVWLKAIGAKGQRVCSPDRGFRSGQGPTAVTPNGTVGIKGDRGKVDVELGACGVVFVLFSWLSVGGGTSGNSCRGADSTRGERAGDCNVDG